MNEDYMQKANQCGAYSKTQVKSNDGSSCYYVRVEQVLGNMFILPARGDSNLQSLAKIACEIQHTLCSHIHWPWRNFLYM